MERDVVSSTMLRAIPCLSRGSPYYVRMTTSQVEPATWVPELTFGARLALVRHRMGWNIKEAAMACGVPPQSWRGWELNGREPHRLTTIAMTIASASGCDYLWLVHGPDRGAPAHTHRYEDNPNHGLVRVIGRVGQTDRHRSPTRPVRQTRPARAVTARPVTPVAV